MLNIIFVSVQNYNANSTIHIHHFALGQSDLGHNVVVCIPDDKQTAKIHLYKEPKYMIKEYEETLRGDFKFPDGRGPDIIHAFTPREIVREQVSQLKKKFPTAKLVVHLEDNEEFILERNMKVPMKKINEWPIEEMDRWITKYLSHPIYYKRLLERCDGVTVIIDKLLEFVPTDKPHLILWPIIDTQHFKPREKEQKLIEKWGLKDQFVICYTGNVHEANTEEVRSLYLAVALANREGIPTKLIRTGKDFANFYGEQKEWALKNTIELGFVNWNQIPSILSVSDMLIQPGRGSDRWNDYRLPSKVPEFLAMGKPVAVPNSNIGKYLKDKEEALILKEGDGLEMLNAIKLIYEDKVLSQKLSNKGREFVLKNFNQEIISKKLQDFYYSLINRKPETVCNGENI